MRGLIGGLYIFGLVSSSGMAEAMAGDDGMLHVGGLYIPGVFAPDEEGPYRALYGRLTEQAPVPVRLHYLPVKRATRDFFGKTIDCLYMVSNDERYYQAHGKSYQDFVGSRPFNHLYMRAYSQRAKPAPGNRDALQKMTLASDYGTQQSSLAQQSLPKAQRVLYTSSLGEAFDLLDSGRAGAVLGYSYDVERFMKTEGRQGYHADPGFALLTLSEQFVCWPTEDARTLVEFLNARIAAMKADGSLARDFGFNP
ncbi:MAG: transporter substrate-binding domain-containing protein [Alphaproteobacteria bacterium]|nr:MAG: transporter substrate-binding domain-containing protein [Alphaproteobacteria bacterium]